MNSIMHSTAHFSWKVENPLTRRLCYSPRKHVEVRTQTFSSTPPSLLLTTAIAHARHPSTSIAAATIVAPNVSLSPKFSFLSPCRNYYSSGSRCMSSSSGYPSNLLTTTSSTTIFSSSSKSSLRALRSLQQWHHYTSLRLFSASPPDPKYSNSSIPSTSTSTSPPPPPLSSSTAPTTITEEDTTLYRDQNSTWLDKALPPSSPFVSLLPYLKLTRMDRPIGTWLVLFPGLWGIALATPAGSLPNLELMVYFAAGAFLMRSAGCTINDMWDKEYDGAVARTRWRPLASKQISFFNALVFLALQLSLGLYILLRFDWPTIALGVCSVPLVAIYPFMKRITYFPQVVLGFAMNYGILMGSTSATAKLRVGEEDAHLGGVMPLSTWGKFQEVVRASFTSPYSSFIEAPNTITTTTTTTPSAGTDTAMTFPSSSSSSSSSPTIPRISSRFIIPWMSIPWSTSVLLPFTSTLALYLGSVGWTVVYDTLYAHQDRKDDKKLGLKSTALWMGKRTPFILASIAVGWTGTWWTVAGLMREEAGERRENTLISASPYLLAVAASVSHMVWQATTANLDDRNNLATRFTSNRYVGWIMLFGIVIWRKFA